jgi:prevent-host-death family protein
MADKSKSRAHRAEWQLHEAKARFSELFRKARVEGPQRVVKQGGEAVIVLPAEEFERLQVLASQPERLVDFFRTAPTGGEELVLDRKRDATRSIDW